MADRTPSTSHPTHSSNPSTSGSASGSGSGTDTRPGTSTSLNDPFASPLSSRAPSIRHQPPSPASNPTSPSYQTSNPTSPIYSHPPSHGLPSSTSTSTSATQPQTLAHSPSTVSFPESFLAPRRSILNQSGFGNSAFSSARSSVARLSSYPNLTVQEALSVDAAVSNGTGNGNGNSATTPNTGTHPPKSKIPRMKSHMLSTTTPLPKPWKEKPSPRATFSYWIVYVIVFFGLAGGAIQSYFTYTRVPLDKRPLCMVFEEHFDDEERVFGRDGKEGTFFREVNMNGFGNGQFDMTTSSRNNSFVSNGKLYIVPTLTADNIGHAAVLSDTVYNITDCTFNITAPDSGFILKDGQRVFDEEGYLNSCSAVSNSTALKVINPVQSARLTTRHSASIRFGRVEVRAKMPNGDWMWPAIWMLPKDEVYGSWPRSGEIDIVESRGNGLRYTAHGSNYVNGALNWGPSPSLNGVTKSYSWWTNKRKSFASDFHTYALEWTPEFLRIYVDTRLHTLLDLRFDRPFFERGEFPATTFNGSSLVPLTNPWTNETIAGTVPPVGNPAKAAPIVRNAAPFDQEFYLILNVAVGSTQGWFPEGQGDKPWLDRAQSPPYDFYKAVGEWYKTWPLQVEERAMIVDYVKMWKHC